MPLADRIRQLREDQNLSLDELALKAKVSKTYLWELEKDTKGEKKPSADILLRIATALSTTIGQLLERPVARVRDMSVELPTGLKALRDQMAKMGTPMSQEDLRDLAIMKFRGGQPKTAEEWQMLYLTLTNVTRRPKQRTRYHSRLHRRSHSRDRLFRTPRKQTGRR